MTFEHQQRYNSIFVKRIKSPTDQLRRYVLANAEANQRACIERDRFRHLPSLMSERWPGRKLHEEMLDRHSYVWSFAIGCSVLSHLQARGVSTKTAKTATPLPANSLVAWTPLRFMSGAGNKARRRLCYLLRGEPVKRERVQQLCGCWLYDFRQKHTCNSNT